MFRSLGLVAMTFAFAILASCSSDEKKSNDETCGSTCLDKCICAGGGLSECARACEVTLGTGGTTSTGGTGATSSSGGTGAGGSGNGGSGAAYGVGGGSFASCFADFCPPAGGRGTPCCVNQDGPCGLDFGNGCERIPPQWMGGTGGSNSGGSGGSGGSDGSGGSGGVAGGGGLAGQAGNGAEAGADAGTEDASGEDAGGEDAGGDDAMSDSAEG